VSTISGRDALTTKEWVETLLTEYLDPRTAANMVKIASRMWLRAEPETLVPAQVLGLSHGLEPMLRTVVGDDLSRAILERVVREATAKGARRR